MGPCGLYSVYLVEIQLLDARHSNRQQSQAASAQAAVLRFSVQDVLILARGGGPGANGPLQRPVGSVGRLDVAASLLGSAAWLAPTHDLAAARSAAWHCSS